MKRRITEISVIQAGRIGMVLYFSMGLFFGVIALLVALLEGSEEIGFRVLTALICVILSPLAGFGVMSCFAAFYNFIAKRIGGFEFSIASEPFPKPTGLFPSAPQQISSQLAEDLRRLTELKEQGLISEQEFAHKRQCLLRFWE
jgi:hypothetical protein